MLLTNGPPGEQSVLVDALICTVKLYVIAPIGLFVVGACMCPGFKRGLDSSIREGSSVTFTVSRGRQACDGRY